MPRRRTKPVHSNWTTQRVQQEAAAVPLDGGCSQWPDSSRHCKSSRAMRPAAAMKAFHTLFTLAVNISLACVLLVRCAREKFAAGGSCTAPRTRSERRRACGSVISSRRPQPTTCKPFGRYQHQNVRSDLGAARPIEGILLALLRCWMLAMQRSFGSTQSTDLESHQLSKFLAPTFT